MNEFAAKNRLSESDWIENQTIDLLLKLRRGTNSFAAFAMIVMALLVYEYVDLWLLLGWLVASTAILIYRYRLKVRYAPHISHANLAIKRKFINKYNFVWTTYAFTLGAFGCLFFANIPVENQYICALMLLIVGFVGVLNLNSQRKISEQFINTLMGTQLAGGLVYVGFADNTNFSPLQYAHLASLLVVWLIFHILDNCLYMIYRKNLVLNYQNNKLIQSLNRRTGQLEQEKQVALNANKVLQRFYSSAAHDIRQPVYALKVYADMATEDIAQVPQLLPKINASCNAIEALFSSLFDYEKLKSGLINVAQQTVDIDMVVDEIESKYRPLARERNLQFRVNAISGFLNTDQDLILRILTCFVTNAIKYTKHGGVLLAVRKTKSSIDFEVWDTGCGIDKANHALIFEEFFKVGEHANADDGLGLGLSVVKSLSGYAKDSIISVNSKLGTGSVFRFALPLKIYAPPYVKSRFDNLKTLPLVLDHDLS